MDSITTFISSNTTSSVADTDPSVRLDPFHFGLPDLDPFMPDPGGKTRKNQPKSKENHISSNETDPKH